MFICVHLCPKWKFLSCELNLPAFIGHLEHAEVDPLLAPRVVDIISLLAARDKCQDVGGNNGGEQAGKVGGESLFRVGVKAAIRPPEGAD